MLDKPYEGLRTFLKGRTEDAPDLPIHVYGIPYDGSNTGRPGARLGPAAIRDASLFLTDGAHPEFEVDPTPLIVDHGDIVTSNTNVNQSLASITAGVADALAGDLTKRALTAFLGGDHTITLGILRAFARTYPGLKVIHFDAHCDTWESHFGDPIGHGTWVRNVIGECLIAPTDIIQIGLRSPVDPKTRDWLHDQGGTVISTKNARNMGVSGVCRFINSVVQANSQGPGRAPVYISFDIDVLDPSAAPGTGTPEVGGLASAFVLDILDELPTLNVVGMDVVEVSPASDHSQITALAAAQMLYTVICGQLSSRRV